MGKLIVCALFAVLACTLPCNAQQNVILFVADGLRAAAVTPKRARVSPGYRDTGVNFSNSHSIYPTITTSNASAIATGHLIGDTGDFGNVFYTGFPVASAAENRHSLHPEQCGVERTQSASRR